MKSIIKQSFILLLLMSVICGGLYTLSMWAIANLAFHEQASGSTIVANEKEYSTLLGQNFSDKKHMWGRVVLMDTSTYQDKDGNPLMYASPSNLSPASDEYEKMVEAQVKKIQAAHPEMDGVAIPVDLVSVSGSGLDTSISVSAANYQVKRLAKANNISEKQVEKIIVECTQDELLGVFGEKTVNVVKVNMMLDKII